MFIELKLILENKILGRGQIFELGPVQTVPKFKNDILY